MFDKDKKFRRARIEQINIGSYDFEALIPFEEKTFTDQDWIRDECEIIDADILNEGNNFLSFSKNLIVELLNQEIDILTFLGYGKIPTETPADGEESDEDFDE